MRPRLLITAALAAALLGTPRAQEAASAPEIMTTISHARVVALFRKANVAFDEMAMDNKAPYSRTTLGGYTIFVVPFGCPGHDTTKDCLGLHLVSAEFNVVSPPNFASDLNADAAWATVAISRDRKPFLHVGFLVEGITEATLRENLRQFPLVVAKLEQALVQTASPAAGFAVGTTAPKLIDQGLRLKPDRLAIDAPSP